MAFARLLARPLIMHGIKLTSASFVGAGMMIATQMSRDNAKRIQEQQQKQAALFQLRPFTQRAKMSDEIQAVYIKQAKTMNPYLQEVLKNGYHLNEDQITFFLRDMEVCHIAVPGADSSINSSQEACDWLRNNFALSAQKLNSTSIHKIELRSLAREVVEKHAEVRKHFEMQTRDASRPEWKSPAPY